MITMFIAIGAALTGFAGMKYGLSIGTGWSVFTGIFMFCSVQLTAGLILRKKIQQVMDEIQRIMMAAREEANAKMRVWQFRPPGSVKEAQREIETLMRKGAKNALATTAVMSRYKRWMPMMEKQIATVKFQLNWILKDFEQVDALMPKAFFLAPEAIAMKMARMYMRGDSIEEIAKIYNKASRRARYNANVILDACYSWILVKRGNADEAHKVLTAALKNSDNQVLKSNHLHLANGRVSHFNNSGLGDQWYSLYLEEPKVKTQHQRQVFR
jgi:hypothetical protein